MKKLISKIGLSLPEGTVIGTTYYGCLGSPFTLYGYLGFTSDKTKRTFCPYTKIRPWGIQRWEYYWIPSDEEFVLWRLEN